MDKPVSDTYLVMGKCTEDIYCNAIQLFGIKPVRDEYGCKYSVCPVPLPVVINREQKCVTKVIAETGKPCENKCPLCYPWSAFFLSFSWDFFPNAFHELIWACQKESTCYIALKRMITSLENTLQIWRNIHLRYHSMSTIQNLINIYIAPISHQTLEG